MNNNRKKSMIIVCVGCAVAALFAFLSGYLFSATYAELDMSPYWR